VLPGAISWPVRSLRRQRGLTLKELGGRAGLSHPFLSQVERGLARPSVVSVERIADALNVPVATCGRRRPREERLLRRTDQTGMRELLAAARRARVELGHPPLATEADGHAGDVLVYVAAARSTSTSTATSTTRGGRCPRVRRHDAVPPPPPRRPSTRALILRA